MQEFKLLDLHLTEGDISKFTSILSQAIKKIDINAQYGKSENTLLHTAAKLGRTQAVILLLQVNANPNSLNKFWETPLSLATKHEQYAVVDYLLKQKNILTEEYNCFGFAPIHVAAGNNNRAILKLFIKAGCSLEIKTKTSGATPLMLATSKNHTENVTLLLAKRANPNASNNVNRTVLYFANQEKKSCLSSLLFWGANLPVANLSQKSSSIIETYATMRSCNSAIKVLVILNELLNSIEKIPSLKQIAGFMIYQNLNHFHFNTSKLPQKLFSYIMKSFPRNLKAGILATKDINTDPLTSIEITPKAKS